MLNLSDKKELLIIALVSVVLSFILFGNGIKGGFVFDDTGVIDKRGDLKDVSNIPNLFISPYHQHMPETGLYRPATMVSYALNYALLGKSPARFHVINILIHALNSILVFFLLKRFTANRLIYYSVFLLFLAHPIHTEAVTWLVGRAELLALLGSLAAILFFEKKLRIWAALAFFLAIMSKETAVMALPIIAYIAWSQSSQKIIAITKRMLIFVPPLVAYVLLRYVALGKNILADTVTTIVENQLKFASFPERVLTALKVLTMYVWKMIWPVHLSVDYSYRTISNVSGLFQSYETLAGLGILAILLFLMIYPRTRRSLWGLGAALFFFPYILISNLIRPIGTIMGERLMYFPSLGFILLLVLLISSVIKRKFLAVAVVMVVFLLYGVRTFARNNDWLSADNLFNAAIKESPNAILTRTALGSLYILKGEWAEAEQELKIAQAINSETAYELNSHLLNLLGIIAQHQGDFKTAEERYKQSIAVNKKAIHTYINLGGLYLKQNRYAEAGENFLKVVEFEPLDEYVIRYAYIQITIGKPDVALEVVKKYYGTRIKDPMLGALLGTAYFIKQDYRQALPYLEMAKSGGVKNPDLDRMIAVSKSKAGVK